LGATDIVPTGHKSAARLLFPPANRD